MSGRSGDQRGDRSSDDEQGQRHDRIHQTCGRGERPSQAWGTAGKKTNGDCGGERNDDEQHQSAEQRANGQIDAEPTSGDRPQHHRQQHQLGDHEHGSEHQKPICGTAGSARECDDVVDARAQQHDEHGRQQRIGDVEDGDETGDDQWDDEEVHGCRHGEKRQVAHRAQPRVERDVEEGEKEQCDEARGQGSFGQSGEAGDTDTEDGPEHRTAEPPERLHRGAADGVRILLHTGCVTSGLRTRSRHDGWPDQSASGQ